MHVVGVGKLIQVTDLASFIFFQLINGAFSFYQQLSGKKKDFVKNIYNFYQSFVYNL